MRGWIEESRDDLRMRQKISHAAAEWQAEDHETDLLYRGTPLLSALEWRSANLDQLGPLENSFLTAALGAAAFGHIDKDPRLALALSTEAIARSPSNAPSFDTRAAINGARRQLSTGRVFLLGSPIPAGEALAIALSPDGTHIRFLQ